MGYISKNIAKETIAPDIVSLSGVSNFLEFTAERENNNMPRYTNIELEIVQTVYSEDDEAPSEEKISNAVFTITELAGDKQSYTFTGTKDPERVDDKTFLLIDNNKPVVAENIRACLLRNPFFRNKFSVTIPFFWDGINAHNSNIIQIQSLGAGELYTFAFGDPLNSGNQSYFPLNPLFATLKGNPGAGSNSDLIDKGMGGYDIEVDVYTNTGVFLGVADTAESTVFPGKLMTTMSKSYFGQPLWFDINALIGTSKLYSDRFLMSGETENGKPVTWVDAGTVNDVRLVAKTYDGTKRESFYYSQVLYALTGYARTLDKVDMDRYVFRRAAHYPQKMKLLTNQPLLPHIEGQSQYLNFVFSDPLHKASNQTDLYSIGVCYELFTHSGKLISTERSLMQAKDLFYTVNTVKLDIDEVIAKVESQTMAKVGIVKAYLCDNRQIASLPLQFRVMPRCLYKINDFAFLNALGGWSSFNFGGEKTATVKSEPNTIYKTQVPRYSTSSQIESVFDKEIKESYTIKTLPVAADVADWLRELTASIAVYELLPDGVKRYVVIDDFDIKHTTKDDLFVLEMKYHYSDTYNGVIK